MTESAKKKVLKNCISKWKFLKEAGETILLKGAGYYIVIKEIVDKRKYEAISLKDVNGMKKLLEFTPVIVFMLISNETGICTIPEKESLSCIT